MTVWYAKSLLWICQWSENPILVYILFTFHARQVWSNAEDNCRPSILVSSPAEHQIKMVWHSMEKQYAQWSMKQPTYPVVSDSYCLDMSWCVCYTRSMSRVGTKKVSEDEAMRSRKLKNLNKVLQHLKMTLGETNPWYREIACCSASSSSARSKKPGLAPYIFYKWALGEDLQSPSLLLINIK